MIYNDVDLFYKVRAILLKYWDPIGISDIPEANDEYDIYIHELCNMLKNKEINKICNYLYKIEKSRMGLNPLSEKQHNLIAKKLIELK